MAKKIAFSQSQSSWELVFSLTSTVFFFTGKDTENGQRIFRKAGDFVRQTLIVLNSTARRICLFQDYYISSNTSLHA